VISNFLDHPVGKGECSRKGRKGGVLVSMKGPPTSFTEMDEKIISPGQGKMKMAIAKEEKEGL